MTKFLTCNISNILDALEGEVEKFVGQPVTPPFAPQQGEMMTPPRQPNTLPTSSNLPNPSHSTYSTMVNYCLQNGILFDNCFDFS